MDKIDSVGSVNEDSQFVDGIAKGSAPVWEEFVRQYTGWTLYRASAWCEKHCAHRYSGLECGIRSVSLRMDGQKSATRGDECDEGMDTYIWIMEQLRKRIMRYTGRNGSRLSTFVWTVLNSKELYVDWIRWKYGRVF